MPIGAAVNPNFRDFTSPGSPHASQTIDSIAKIMTAQQASLTSDFMVGFNLLSSTFYRTAKWGMLCCGNCSLLRIYAGG